MTAIAAWAGRRPYLAALLVLAVGHAVMIGTRTYLPAGDWAFLELRTRDVFSSRTPLTGAWSRYGWNHPGPFLFDALAVPRLLAGGSWRGLWFGAVALNLLAIGIAVWLAERHSRLLAALLALAATWTVAVGTPHLFADPWNASVVVLPAVTALAASVAVRSSDRRGVPVACVVFVAAAQTHAAYGVLLLPLLLVVLAVGWRHWRRWTLLGVGIGALMCIPALVDAVVDPPGNLWRALRFTLTSDEPAVGAGEALRVIGRSSSLTFFGEPILPSFVSNVSGTPWGVVPFAGLMALAGAWWTARRHGWRAWCLAAEGTGLIWFGGFVMTSRTRGPLLIWLTTWTVVAAALTWCVVAGVAVEWFLRRRRRHVRHLLAADGTPSTRPPSTRPPSTRATDDPATTPADGPDSRQVSVAIGVVAVLALALAAGDVARSVGEGYPFQEQTAVIEQFARDAAPYLAEPLVIDLEGDEYLAGAVQSGMIAHLEALGTPALGRPDQALQLGEHRVGTELTAPRLLVQVVPRRSVGAGAEVVSVHDPLDEASRATVDRLMDELAALLTSAGLDDRIELLANDLAPLAAIDGPPEVTARRSDFERLGALHGAGPRIVLQYIAAPPA